MKYLKRFEEEDQLPDSYFEVYPRIYGDKPKDEKYWLITNDKEKFEKAVREVCDHEGWIQLMLNNQNRFEVGDERYIFIGRGYEQRFDKDGGYWQVDWGWNSFDGYPRDEFYEDHNYKFMGYLGLTEDEENSFEIMIAAKNYNL